MTPLDPLGHLAALILAAAVTTSLSALPGHVTPRSADSAPGAAAPSPPAEAPGDTAADSPGPPATGRAERWVCPVDGCRLVRDFDPPALPWGSGHRGVDLSGSTTIRAPQDGVVSYAQMLAGRPVLVVAHADGLRSTFEPVDALVPVGTPVARGEPVGRVAAEPAHCPEPGCVHWGVKRGDDYLDPMSLLGRPRRVVLLPVATR